MRIEARRISAGYGRELVVQGVDVSLSPGQFVGLIGPNGAGKTTLLRALSRTLPLRAGELIFDGQRADSFTAREVARKIAFVPQVENALFDFSVRDVVLMGRYPHLRDRARETDTDFAVSARAMAATDTLQLAERPVTALSGGEFRRVLIARALAQSTPTLLLDEPTAHLDLAHQRDLLTLLRRQVDTENAACLAALHDLNLAAAFCDRLILIAGGRIVAQGESSDVLQTEVLSRGFGPGITVSRSPVTGGPIVLPEPPPVPQVGGKGIHVVCGGGSGAELLSLLRRRGHRVTAGVLNGMDSDQITCEDLGIEHVAERPFSPIGEESIAACRELMAAAEIVLIAEMPIGPGNLANLRLVEEFQRKGKPVYLAGGPPFSERDFCGGEAAEILERLVRSGAVTIADSRELDAALASNPAAEAGMPA